MIDPLDSKTNSLPLSTGEISNAPHADTDLTPTATNVLKLQSPLLPDEQKLSADFDLVRIHAPVYMLDKIAASKRSAGAERVEKHRKKQAAEGLRPAAVPGNLLDEVKAAGGWAEWQAQVTATAVAAAIPPPPASFVVEVPGPERIVIEKVEVPGPERIVEVPTKLTQSQATLLELGRSVRQLAGWRRALAQLTLGSAVVIPPKK